MIDVRFEHLFRINGSIYRSIYSRSLFRVDTIDNIVNHTKASFVLLSLESKLDSHQKVCTEQKNHSFFSQKKLILKSFLANKNNCPPIGCACKSQQKNLKVSHNHVFVVIIVISVLLQEFQRFVHGLHHGTRSHGVSGIGRRIFSPRLENHKRRQGPS